MRCAQTMSAGRSVNRRIAANVFFLAATVATTAVAFLCLLFPAVAEAQTVSAGSASGSPGTTVDLSIGFSAGSQAVATLQFDLSYSSALSAVSTSTGAAASAAGKTATGSSTAGTTRILIFGLNQNAIGSGELAVVRLSIASGTPSSSLPISVSNIVASDAAGKGVATSGSDGVVVVIGPPDVTPPSISQVSASWIGQTSAIITWTTDEAADSQVDFGTTASYGASASDAGRVTSHSLSLNGLLASTTYHYRVKSKDSAGNLATTGDYTFVTLASNTTPPPPGPTDTTPPAIVGLTVSNITGTDATVSWTTNEGADTQVEYGLTNSYGTLTTLNALLTTSHSLTLRGLAPNTLYHYRVRSSDAAGNLSISADGTFTTGGATSLVLYYPRMLTRDVAEAGSIDQEFTGIGIANLNSQAATLRFSVYNSDGVLLSGPGITNPSTRQLQSGQQLPIMDQELFGTSVSGHDATGWVKIESDVGSVTGFYLMFNGRLSELDGADMYSTPITSFVFPEINDNGFNKINIGNPNSVAATLTFSLFAAPGYMRSAQTRTIPANGALVADMYADIFRGISVDATDYVKVLSTQPVLPYQVMGNFGDPVAGAQDLQSLHGQDASAGTTRLYCPQYIIGESWRSSVSLVNLDMAAGDVSISFIGQDGTQIGSTRIVQIESLGKFRLDDPRFFEPYFPSGVHEGYLLITSSKLRLTGNVVFGDAQRRFHSTALPLVKTLDQSIVFSHVSSNDKYYTGVAIVNPNQTDAHVTIQVFSGDGSSGISTPITIPAGRRISRLLTELFPAIAGQQRYSGYFQVTSDVGVASFAVFGTWDLTLLSAIPPQTIR